MLRLIGYDLRLPPPNRFYEEPYLGVDDAGWDWPQEYSDAREVLDAELGEFNSHLVCRLDALASFRRRKGIAESVLIAIGIVLAELDSAAITSTLNLDCVEPPVPRENWEFLGFDIANRWFESVFVHFGKSSLYDGAERHASSGLIMESSEALRICAIENAAPEDIDGPVFCFAVFLLDRE